MDGNDALRHLNSMTEDQRKAVRLLWFDEEHLDNFQSVGTPEYDKECEFFYNLSNEERGKLIEKGLYTDGGDWTQKHNEFLDNFVERFKKALDEKMAETEKMEKMTSKDGYKVLDENYNDIVEKVTSVSKVFVANNAQLDNENPFCLNPTVSFVNEISTGLSFVETDEFTGRKNKKPWTWWVENVKESEYHKFATFEEALEDWLKNIPRIDQLKTA